MAGHFILELDTTPPVISIYAPTYSDKGSDNEIRIASNEAISSYQDIYLIDSEGTRHDAIFYLVGDRELVGNIVFSQLSIGIATIFAQVKDEVGNISNLASKSINIISSNENLLMKVLVSGKERVVKVLDRSHSNVFLLDRERPVSISDKELSEVLISDREYGNVSIYDREKQTKISDLD